MQKHDSHFWKLGNSILSSFSKGRLCSLFGLGTHNCASLLRGKKALWERLYAIFSRLLEIIQWPKLEVTEHLKAILFYERTLVLACKAACVWYFFYLILTINPK